MLKIVDVHNQNIDMDSQTVKVMEPETTGGDVDEEVRVDAIGDKFTWKQVLEAYGLDESTASAEDLDVVKKQWDSMSKPGDKPETFGQKVVAGAKEAGEKFQSLASSMHRKASSMWSKASSHASSMWSKASKHASSWWSKEAK